MPTGVEDRDADVWEALLSVADAAGGHWPDTARRAAVTLVTDSKAAAPSLGVLLLRDIRDVMQGDVIFTEDLLELLHNVAEAPWTDLRGKPLNDRGLANRLRRYGISSQTVRIGGRTAKGYRREDFADPWTRYLPPGTGTPTDGVGAAGHRSVTSVTPSHQTLDCDGVTDVTDVRETHSEAPPTRPCGHPGDPATKCGACIAEALNNRAAECRLCGRPAVPGSQWCNTADSDHENARQLVGDAA
jgi:hypothetical protein